MTTSDETKQGAEAGFSPGAPCCATAVRTAAFALYRPPFKFMHGYIFDADHQMFSDDGAMDETAARIRGWGRIQKLEQAEKLQDELGQMFAEALTVFWLAHNAQGELPASPARGVK